MSWNLTGRMIEVCSCKLPCPCALGPAEPDQGWCSGALTFVIDEGKSDAVDLSGRTVVWMIDLPKDFATGDGTARLYVDDGADAAQVQELEAIFTGGKGGPGEVLASLVSQWLPTEKVAIDIHQGERPAVSVNGVGQADLDPVKDSAGRLAGIVNAPVLGLIAIERADLARAEGARFDPPDMRSWQGGGHASISPVVWRV